MADVVGGREFGSGRRAERRLAVPAWAWLVGCVLVLPQAVCGEDWPQWRGPARNGVTTEPSGWPKGWPPKRLWRRDVGKGCTSPVIVGGRLYIMGWSGRRGGGNPVGTDTLYCFDAAGGKELWKQTYRCRYQGRVRAGDLRGYGGPSATPTFDKTTGRLYTLSVDGDLRCWDTKHKGRLLWAVNLYDKYKNPQRPFVGQGRRDYGFTSSPLIRGELLILEVGAREGTVMAFDKKTGARKWSSAWKKPAGHTGGPAPLTVEGKSCIANFALFELVIMRIDEGNEGRTVGTLPWKTDFACNVATPGVSGAKVVVTSAYNHKHTSLLEVSLGGIRKLWTSKEYALVSSPVIHRGRIFLMGKALTCLDLATGREKWDGPVLGHGSALITGDGKLMAFGNGSLVLAEAMGEKYRQLARVDKIVGGTCYPHVALADGIIACKDKEGRLVCFSVAQKAGGPKPRR